MTDTRYIKLLRAAKRNAPHIAQRRLNQLLTRREELALDRRLAHEKNDEKQLAKITELEVEVEEYIQALT